MAKIILHNFKASNGDAFLLKFDNGQNILIDMGLPKTYENEIKNELIKLNDNGEKIDLLIITHIDEDHIGGAIEFLKDNIDNKIIKVDEIWHNSYKHLHFEKNKINYIDKDSLSILNNIILQNTSNVSQDSIHNISMKQGSSFASLVHKGKYSWNTSFSHNAIHNASNTLTQIKKEDVNFILLSPDKEKLEKLSNKWLKELKQKKYSFDISDEVIFDDALEFYMKFEEDNISKVSNISYDEKFKFEELSQIDEIDRSVTKRV